MSLTTERAAVACLLRAFTAWIAVGNDLFDFEEDDAILALLAEGIRPSALSADLDDLTRSAVNRLNKDLRS